MTARKRRPPAGLLEIQERIGYTFKDEGLLDLSLTHRSHGHETGRRTRNNETLELLGDAVLGFLVAERLFREAGARAAVGSLARERGALVSEAFLAPRARALRLGEALRLGKGEETTGGREKDSLLADAFEAVVAAIYLDGGMDAARDFVHSQFPPATGAERHEILGDAKTRLQEALQARGRPLPEYRVAASAGPDHDRSFSVEVLVGGKAVARGEGRSKKSASMEAARKALARLKSILGPRGFS